MFENFEVFKALIMRYDYGGALIFLKKANLEHFDACRLVDMCRHAVNFDFETAMRCLKDVSHKYQKTDAYRTLYDNLEALNDGEAGALLTELLENLKFQIVNEQYIDFLGRVYRFKEAIYKYLFIKTQMKDRTFTFNSRFMQKKEILKVLRNHYKIYNSNLTFALNSYFSKHVLRDDAIGLVLRTMNTESMNQLIELRHDSLIGHGFKGVSYEQIQTIYGDPYHVLDDFKACIAALHIPILPYKYTLINEVILEWLKDEGGFRENI